MTDIIRKCTMADVPQMLRIINDAAQAYKGVIPADRWHDPYMPETELREEMEDGVEFWGYESDGALAGVMGIQDRGDAALIRHAYVETRQRSKGIGSKLLRHLEGMTAKPILIGTWLAATWAIRFYEKNGYHCVSREETERLLRKYWRIPERQIETSVVLKKEGKSVTKQRVIFLSSVCDDLTDLRAELKEWLEKDDFLVKVSDQDSAFIESSSDPAMHVCLNNLRNSDFVVFIFDREYGNPQPAYRGRSATHVEWREAKANKPDKYLVCVRRKTIADYRAWLGKGCKAFKNGWVPKGKQGKLFGLFKKIRIGTDTEPWLCDFDDSTDLRGTVANQLYNRFPEHAGWRAKRRDRVARLCFGQDKRAPDPGAGLAQLEFSVSNAGLNPATAIRVRVKDSRGESVGIAGTEPNTSDVHVRAALAVGEKSAPWRFRVRIAAGDCEIVCEYENLWEDKYEVRAKLKREPCEHLFTISPDEKFTPLSE